ncbi:MAG: hypothetical protein HN731_15705 [Rhodospirillaceae bacterium]|nr:hypothetical protein [Rhodospirillaceae bacterium]
MTDYIPSDEVMAVWPKISGSDINRRGKKDKLRPHPIFWRNDLDSFPHGGAQGVFLDRSLKSPAVQAAWGRRQKQLGTPVSDVASKSKEKSPEEWTELIKKVSLESGAVDVGICAYRPEWTYDDRPIPTEKWAIVLVVAHDYDKLKTAPDENSLAEVVNQYGSAAKASLLVTSWVHEQGWSATSKPGPRAEDVILIPAEIESGVAELGKHGSIINRKHGSNVRLSLVLTDIPLVSDKPEPFGGDLFCQSCQVCSNAFPVDAIEPEKQWVNGEVKWYTDFDKCVPYFVDNMGCGLCIAQCPWSRPGVTENLITKMAKRMASKATESSQ